jgi:hypothetical protein
MSGETTVTRSITVPANAGRGETRTIDANRGRSPAKQRRVMSMKSRDQDVRAERFLIPQQLFNARPAELAMPCRPAWRPSSSYRAGPPQVSPAVHTGGCPSVHSHPTMWLPRFVEQHAPQVPVKVQLPAAMSRVQSGPQPSHCSGEHRHRPLPQLHTVVEPLEVG